MPKVKVDGVAIEVPQGASGCRRSSLPAQKFQEREQALEAGE